MELKINSEIKNPLFNRIEIQAEGEKEITPTTQEIIEFLAKKYSKELENVVVKKIQGYFGINKFEVEALVYETLKDKEKTEPRVKTKEKK